MLHSFCTFTSALPAVCMCVCVCALPNMAYLCSSLISCFPGTLLRYCLCDFEMVPVAPITTGTTFALTFHIIIIIINNNSCLTQQSYQLTRLITRAMVSVCITCCCIYHCEKLKSRPKFLFTSWSELLIHLSFLCPTILFCTWPSKTCNSCCSINTHTKTNHYCFYTSLNF